MGACIALAKGFQRGKALHRVQKLSSECFVIAAALEAALTVPAVKYLRGDESEKRRRQHDERNRHIQKSHHSKNHKRRQDRHHQLRQILPEVNLKLLDALDHRHNGIARALKTEVGRAEPGDLIKNHRAQMKLHDRCRVVRHHRSPILQNAAGDHHQRHPGKRH